MFYGKIIDGQLIIAGLKITNKVGGTITRPTDNDYLENGWLPVVYTEKPQYDIENEKLQEKYFITNLPPKVNDGQQRIFVEYEIVALTEEEKRDILQNKVFELEQQYNMCRWQREIILSENSQASDYTKTKAQQIEDLAKELR